MLSATTSTTSTTFSSSSGQKTQVAESMKGASNHPTTAQADTFSKKFTDFFRAQVLVPLDPVVDLVTASGEKLGGESDC